MPAAGQAGAPLRRVDPRRWRRQSPAFPPPLASSFRRHGARPRPTGRLGTGTTPDQAVAPVARRLPSRAAANRAGLAPRAGPPPSACRSSSTASRGTLGGPLPCRETSLGQGYPARASSGDEAECAVWPPVGRETTGAAASDVAARRPRGGAEAPHGAGRRAPRPGPVRELHPDGEPERHHTHLGEQFEAAGVRHGGAGRERADQDAADHVADHQRLAHDPGEAAADEGSDEHIGQVAEVLSRPSPVAPLGFWSPYGSLGAQPRSSAPRCQGSGANHAEPLRPEPAVAPLAAPVLRCD